MNAELTHPLAWHAPPAQLKAALEQPVWAILPELGMIEAQGPDAGAFLQAQLSNDSALAQKHLCRNGYCTPQGRLLAVFDHFSDGQTHFLQLPREILPSVMKRLSMYVLRSKVKLRDVSDEWAAIGLLGPGSAQALANARLPAPEAGDSVLRDGLLIARQPDGTRASERFLLIGSALRAGCEPLKAQSVDSGVWWWSQIDAGVPNVWAATQEKFVPQMINLEVLGGVDFRKGCYPGQEVIARSQYRGKLRRRMHLAHTQADTHAGADVLAQGQDQPVGTVVMAACAPQGGMDFLFECHADAVGASLYVQGATPDRSVLPRALPYSITDVTA